MPKPSTSIRVDTECLIEFRTIKPRGVSSTEFMYILMNSYKKRG